jgi:hypothetical protein
LNLIQQAEQNFDDARREHIKAQVAERAARAKVEAAAQRLGELRFKGVEVSMDVERMRKEGELR